jgi:hypothetical protein
MVESEHYWNTSHLCRSKTQRRALKTVEQYRVKGERARKSNKGFDWLKYNIFTGKIPRQNPKEQW